LLVAFGISGRRTLRGGPGRFQFAPE